jgi:alanyl-tRNA synthetase
MRSLSGNQIREDFLRFFEGKCSAAGACHRRVHSSSLVPHNDPTLLFTNAGMNQFKDVFLGAEVRDYTRATSSQKCVRAGGKHNDLENVGFTRRHHTFFEMLGNFSFGDYFKQDAIAYAWELLTKVWEIDPARLYITIFEGLKNDAGEQIVPRDTEAEQFWIATGVPRERIFEMGYKDNFWQMGETGPCGPCSEIFYDLGLHASEQRNADGSPQDLPFPQDEQRYVEIWNLVFMQFDRTVDANGTPTLTPLPKPSIDTGMGLERIAAVLQGKLSNYESDLFTPLIQRAAELTDPSLLSFPSAAPLSFRSAAPLSFPSESPLSFPSESPLSFRSAAPLSFPSESPLSFPSESPLSFPSVAEESAFRATTDAPSQPEPTPTTASSRPEAAGRSGETPVFPAHTGSNAGDTIDALALSDAKPAASLRIIADHARASTFLINDGVIPSNEGRGYVLRKILRRGIRHGRLLGQDAPFMHQMVFAVRDEMQTAYPELAESADRISSVVLAEEQQFARTLELGLRQMTEEVLRSGEKAFSLYETYGMPLDFMVDAARDAGIDFDTEGFERTMQEEQARARASWKGGSQKSAAPVYRELVKTEFQGYSATRLDGARILAIVKDGLGIHELKPGEQAEVILDATSFYADSGGQVGDTGWLYASDHITPVAEVTATRKPIQGVFAHTVTARQTLAVNETVDAVADAQRRHDIMRNHTATHLLHAALRQTLGTHVKQAGSLNDASRLRFDFSHFAGLGETELSEIEDIVNAQVLANTAVQTLVDVPIDQAVHELGAMALFGEKYGDRVRVVKIGDFSTELCGGTHTTALGEIGLIKITSESAVASGTRRVEAVTGTSSLHEFRRDFETSRTALHFAGAAGPAALQTKLSQQEDELKKLRRELEQMRMKSASAATANAAESAIEVASIKVLAQRVDSLDKSAMRNLVDELRGKLGSGIVVLGAATAEGKASLIVGVTKDLTPRIQAGRLVGMLAQKVGGKGGGRPDLAEAGGPEVAALDAALAAAPEAVLSLLS